MKEKLEIVEVLNESELNEVKGGDDLPILFER